MNSVHVQLVRQIFAGREFHIRAEPTFQYPLNMIALRSTPRSFTRCRRTPVASADSPHAHAYSTVGRALPWIAGSTAEPGAPDLQRLDHFSIV